MIFAPHYASACSCAEPNEAMAAEAYAEMDYVFEGEIISTAGSSLNRQPLAIIKIKRLYKGALEASEVGFAYNPRLSTCGMELKTGETVTFGAYDVAASPPRVAHICAQMAVRKYLIMNGGYPR